MQKSGFFNALLKNGEYDRKYSADDYCDNLAVVISNGVLRGVEDDLRVTASGMVVSVGVGRAWINGHYYVNDTPHAFAAISAPIGGARYDRVVLRLDTNLDVRSISLVYKQGTAADSPQRPALIRDGNIYELCLADIYISANSTSLQITDTRGDKDLCGWVYSTSGDNSFFESLDNAFLTWFDEKKDTLASVTLFKRYTWRTVLERASTEVVFAIPQYDAETCFLDVYVNGTVITAGVDYTLAGDMVTFPYALVAGSEVEIKCYKSIDGTGIMSVADEITELQQAVLNINTAGTFFYTCNGVNDNVVISEMAQNFINGGDDMGVLTITISGKFGATAPHSGDGSEAKPYTWFTIGAEETKKRRVVLDFAGCEGLSFSQGAYPYYLFKGRQYTVKNLCLNVDGLSSRLYGQPYYFGEKNVYFDNCRIYANVGGGWIAHYGTFRDCEFTMKGTATDDVISINNMYTFLF